MWYRTGTMTVTNGSPTVTGVGTSWIANAAIGEGVLAPDNRIYEIVNIASDTSITLGSNYLGSNSSGQTYVIVPTQSYIRDLATQAATLINNYSTIYNTIGQGEFAEGTLGAPSVSFQTDTDTGFYHSAANEVTFVANGIAQFKFNTSGLSILNGTTLTSTAVSTGQVDITAQGDLRLQDSTGGEYVALQAPATVAASYTLTLPADDGASGQALVTDGSGVLSWSSAASGDVYGPASATDNAIARFDGTTGKLIQNSAVTIGDDGATAIAVTSSTDALRITQLGIGNALVVEDSANPDATPFVVQNDGRTLLGSPTSYNGVFNAAFLQAHAVGGNGTIDGFRYTADAFGVDIGFLKSRSATTGTQTVVQSGDALGVLRFAGSDGAAFKQAATIEAAVDGTPGTNDMPGRLVFSTTADGASSPTERMRIDSAGRVGFGAVRTSARVAVENNMVGYGGVDTTGIIVGATINDAALTSASGFSTFISPNTGTNLTTLSHFAASQRAYTGTATSQHGFLATASLIGATNNYGFRGEIPAGTGRYNFYAAGTAANYLGGILSFGTWGIGTAGEPNIIKIYDTGTPSTSYGIGLSSGQLNIVAGGDTGFYAGAALRGKVTNSGVWSLGAAPGAESLRVTPVASAVNYTEVRGSVTSGSPLIFANGSDANVGLALSSKGVSGNLFYTNAGANLQFVVGHTASAVNYWNFLGSSTGNEIPMYASGSDANIGIVLASKGSGSTYIQSNGGTTQFRVAHTASAVNYLQVTGAPTTGRIALSAQGADTNIGVVYALKGAEAHVFASNGGANTQFAVGYAASAVNYLQINGNATGSAPYIFSAGSDANIDLSLIPKGTGNVKFGTLTANADAPVTGYITIRDAGGTLRKLAVIA